MLLSLFLWFPSIIATIALSLPPDHQASLHLIQEVPDPMNSYNDLQAVPGDSPAFYVGDPSNDILSINALDLLPNPPIE